MTSRAHLPSTGASSCRLRSALATEESLAGGGSGDDGGEGENGDRGLLPPYSEALCVPNQTPNQTPMEEPEAEGMSLAGKISFDVEDRPPPSYYGNDSPPPSLKFLGGSRLDKSEWWKAPEFVPRCQQVVSAQPLPSAASPHLPSPPPSSPTILSPSSSPTPPPSRHPFPHIFSPSRNFAGFPCSRLTVTSSSLAILLLCILKCHFFLRQQLTWLASSGPGGWGEG